MTRVPLGRYRHYMGKECTVRGIARHNEALEVVYRQKCGDRGLWVRLAAMFAEILSVGGEATPRFRSIAAKVHSPHREGGLG